MSCIKNYCYMIHSCLFPQVVAEAEAVVVFLNATYQPARIPADVKDVFSRMVLAGAAAS